MKRKIIIVSAFIGLFAIALLIMEMMKMDALRKSENVIAVETIPAVAKADNLNEYTVTNLSEDCRLKDQIYCAVEKVVKCTMKPDMNGCTEEDVPSFVLGDAGETPRPTKVSFKIEKIKRVSTLDNISVYTQSDCDAQWFGLCKGTVIYSLEPKENGWRVTNVYALE